LKVINNEFGANIVKLEKALNTAKAEVGLDEDIRDQIGAPETKKETNCSSPPK